MFRAEPSVDDLIQLEAVLSREEIVAGTSNGIADAKAAREYVRWGIKGDVEDDSLISFVGEVLSVPLLTAE